MKSTLSEILEEASKNNRASGILIFPIWSSLRAIMEAAKNFNAPVMKAFPRARENLSD